MPTSTDAGIRYTPGTKQKVLVVAERLDRVYGSPRLENPFDPVDDLIFILLSGRTGPEACVATFHALKAKYEAWDALAREGDSPALRAIMRGAGLSQRRSTYLAALLRRLIGDFGTVTLDPLRSMSAERAEEYLVGLPGVGCKTAKCVLLYALGRKVFPVDAHVRRILGRLGLMNPAVRLEYAQQAVESLVPARVRYSLHVNLVAHGRAVCRGSVPRCADCAVRGVCAYAKSSPKRPQPRSRRRSRR
ncbi:MAG: endonuclease III [Deltaproteobacteria bacterium]|nr:endonuclease III [Deltaproteobacteria bacterium]